MGPETDTANSVRARARARVRATCTRAPSGYGRGMLGLFPKRHMSRADGPEVHGAPGGDELPNRVIQR